jgi:hypothetical protein
MATYGQLTATESPNLLARQPAANDDDPLRPLASRRPPVRSRLAPPKALAIANYIIYGLLTPALREQASEPVAAVRGGSFRECLRIQTAVPTSAPMP